MGTQRRVNFAPVPQLLEIPVIRVRTAPARLRTGEMTPRSTPTHFHRHTLSDEDSS